MNFSSTTHWLFDLIGYKLRSKNLARAETSIIAAESIEQRARLLDAELEKSISVFEEKKADLIATARGVVKLLGRANARLS